MCVWCLGAVLVYCKEGVSRSATIVIAFLMSARGLLLDEALKKVKAARWMVWLCGCRLRTQINNTSGTSVFRRRWYPTPAS